MAAVQFPFEIGKTGARANRDDQLRRLIIHGAAINAGFQDAFSCSACCAAEVAVKILASSATYEQGSPVFRRQANSMSKLVDDRLHELTGLQDGKHGDVRTLAIREIFLCPGAHAWRRVPRSG